MERVYFDANFFIYLVEGLEAYRWRVSTLSDLVAQKQIAGITGEITLAETLVAPRKNQDIDKVLAYKRLLCESEMFQLVSITTQMWESAAGIRARYGVGLADALHLAVAQESRCTFFLTNDKRLKSLPGLEVIYLGDENAELRVRGVVQEPAVTYPDRLQHESGTESIRTKLRTLELN
jgi:predicted nucleic acid-binding protein